MNFQRLPSFNTSTFPSYESKNHKQWRTRNVICLFNLAPVNQTTLFDGKANELPLINISMK